MSIALVISSVLVQKHLAYNKMTGRLTLWIRFFEGIPCVDIAGGRVVFILELHVKSGRLTEGISWSYIKNTHIVSVHKSIYNKPVVRPQN